MKTVFNLICGLFIFTGTYGQTADDVLGTWLTGEKRSHIEIYKTDDGKYNGKIVWLKEEVDGQGVPKKGKNGQKLMGLVILKDFVFEDDEWTDGTIYDPESGKTYYATMELDGSDELDVRGSVDPMGWIGRTDEWARVE